MLTWLAKRSALRRTTLCSTGISGITPISSTVWVSEILRINWSLINGKTASCVATRITIGWATRRACRRWRGRRGYRGLVTDKLGKHVRSVIRGPWCTAASFTGRKTEPPATRMTLPGGSYDGNNVLRQLTFCFSSLNAMTLGTRDLSCLVSGFSQPFKVIRQPAVDHDKFPHARKKPLIPRANATNNLGPYY